jgi:hypothetical protein
VEQEEANDADSDRDRRHVKEALERIKKHSGAPQASAAAPAATMPISAC